MPPRKKIAAKPPAAAAKAQSTNTGVNNTAANAAAAVPLNGRALPTKEAELFRQVLNYYETKQFKTGLAAVQQILDLYPEHGESLAMKGIFLTSTGEKESGYATVKRGIAKDPGSHIVWHVYALILRADKNFEEALKCYKKAVSIEPDSLSLINDLAQLSVHLRYYQEYAAARMSILRVQPRIRRNWVYLAVAQHLAGQYFEADRTLTCFESMIREVPDGEYEYSEILLYHAQLLEESGDLERTLEFLSEHMGEIVDRSAYQVQRAHILLKLGRSEPADWAWEVLLEENPDSYEYIKASVLAKGADCDSKDSAVLVKAVQILDQLAEKYPRSLAIRRITLDLVSGDDFRNRASSYLINALAKGIPSIFVDVKALYDDDSKRQIIGELAESYRASLESSNTFGSPSVIGDDDTDTVESTTSYLWTLYFLAQHYSALDDHSQALSILSLATAHTPSLPELSMLRARVLKRAGDPVAAVEAMEEARALDGQDRFLNSKSAKYLVRADRVEEAEKVLGLFTKKDASSPLEDLIEMQCLWILQEEAESYVRQKKYARALKRYHQMFKLFTDIEEDQYDFHGYCVRKGTLRSYVQLLRYMDTLRSHPRFVAAAKGAIAIYLALHDNPSSVRPALTAADKEEERKLVAEDEEKRRLMKEKMAKERAEEKARLEKERLEKEKNEKKVVKGGKDKGKTAAVEKKPEPEEPEEEPVYDADPRGLALLKTEKPLEEALAFLRPLQKEAAKEIETWLLTFEVSMRRGKHLQALRALRTAQSLSPSSPALRPLIARFAALASESTFLSSQTDHARATIEQTLPELLDGVGLEHYATNGLQIIDGAGTDGEQILAAAEASREIRGQAAKGEVEQLVFQLLRDDVRAKLKTALGGFALLQQISSSRIEEFRSQAVARYPLARAFKTADEIEALDAALEMKAKSLRNVDGDGDDVDDVGGSGDSGKEVVE